MTLEKCRMSYEYAVMAFTAFVCIVTGCKNAKPGRPAPAAGAFQIYKADGWWTDKPVTWR